MVASAGLGAGAVFISPAEGPVPFRRDRVPLDVETLMDLGGRLAVFADAVEGEDAGEMRRAAQLLALSLALDPVNPTARKVLREFKEGIHHAYRDPKAGDDRDWIDRTRKWLGSGEAGGDGNALAACVADAMNPESDAGADSGAWTSWVAEISMFEDVLQPEEPAVVAQSESKAPKIQLLAASVTVPLWKVVADSEPPVWELALSTLVMSATEKPVGEAKKESFTLVLGNPQVNRNPSAEVGPLRRLLRDKAAKLPDGATVTISSPELAAVVPKRKHQSFSAAAAVLASAALTGEEPTGTIIGQVDASGKLTLPNDYWEQLRSLSAGDSSRLILPAAAAEDLPSLLVMGDPGFFMDHQVLLAKDFKQLLELSAKKAGGAVGQSISSFSGIQKQGSGRLAGPFVARTSVRRALTELAQTAPFHASARMLAVQGAGDRPSYVSRRVLLAELRMALEPMQWLVAHGQNAFTPDQQKKIGETSEICRSAVEQLQRISEKADQPTLVQALEMLTSIRGLYRSSRSRSDAEEGQMSSAEVMSYNAFLRARKNFLEKLGPASVKSEE